MENRIITLCYRKIIDIDYKTPWERLVFEDSFKEFKIQSAVYNQNGMYKTYADMLHHVPNAEKITYLVSSAIINYLRQLNDVVPDITNNIGKKFLTFQNFKFEIVNSDVTNIEKHRIAISFYSDPLHWIETIGQYILVSNEKQKADGLTDLFTIQPFLTIHSVK